MLPEGSPELSLGAGPDLPEAVLTMATAPSIHHRKQCHWHSLCVWTCTELQGQQHHNRPEGSSLNI